LPSGGTQELETGLGCGAQQPEAQVMPPLWPAYAPLHAHKDLFGPAASEDGIAGQAREVAGDRRLIAGDERTPRPLGARARLRRQTCLALFLWIGATARTWPREAVLPDHVRLSFPRGAHATVRDSRVQTRCSLLGPRPRPYPLQRGRRYRCRELSR